MNLKNLTKVILCLCAVLPALSLGQTVSGGVYTFTNSNAVQVSTIVGSAKINTLVLRVPTGACAKVYIGTQNLYPVNYEDVIKAIFPSACSGPTPPIGVIEDSWSICDFIQNADGVLPSDYWVAASAGAQVEWQTTIVGVAAAKILHPVLAGLAYQGGPPSTAGAGDSKVEINVIPGGDWKVNVCVAGANYLSSCFYDMYPMYYLSSGALTTPTPGHWEIQSKTLNGLTNNFVIATSTNNELDAAFIAAYQYQ